MREVSSRTEVSLSELAGLMQTTVPRIIRLVEGAGLPAYRVGGEIRFHIDEVTEWMTSRSLAIRAREPRRRASLEAHASRP